MALIKDPEARAAKVSTKLQAARLHEELESELALVPEDELPTGWEERAERALKDLEGRYGGADELREVDTSNPSKASARPWTPSLSGAAKRGLGTGELDRDASRSAAPSTGDGSRSAPRAPSSRQRAEGRQRSATRRGAGGPSGRRRSAGRSGGRAARAWRQTGVPGQATSLSVLALQIIGVTIGLSAVYLLLSNAGEARRGGSIVELLAGGLQTAVKVVMDPVDPLAFDPNPMTRGITAVNERNATENPSAQPLVAPSMYPPGPARRRATKDLNQAGVPTP